MPSNASPPGGRPDRRSLGDYPASALETASRLTFYLLRNQDGLAEALAEALQTLRSGTVLCEAATISLNVALCHLFRSWLGPGHDLRGRTSRWTYWQLERNRRVSRRLTTSCTAHCHRSTAYIRRNCASPSWLRAQAMRPHEVILATNPSLEGGEYGGLHLPAAFPLSVNVTRLARGLPVGGDLEYTDEVTLARAPKGAGAMR